MKLIYADKLKELYEDYEGLKVPCEVVLQNIDDMPTAYDIDEIIEQFEETFDRWGLDDGKKEIMREIVKGGAE